MTRHRKERRKVVKAMVMSPEKLKQALAIKDLTDPRNGIHAINLLIERIKIRLSQKEGWPAVDLKRSASPISSVANDFDRLYFPVDSPSRSPVYTRYIDETRILRTHTTAMIPDLLVEMKQKGLTDYVVLCPGICYRRDVTDRKHTGEPHQMDIWRVKKGEPRLQRPALIDLIETIVDIVAPGRKYRTNKVTHPYTINGLEVEALVDGEWLELLEYGEAHPRLLADCGLNPKEYSGLAMGIGLDRAVMIIKGIDDIRILRSEDPKIKRQMVNLDSYIPVSKYPPIRQDMSIAVSADTTEEDICETIRDTLGVNANIVEEVKIISSTAYDELPPQAIERLGIRPGQKNLLIRVILRSHERSLRHEEANEIRDRLYRALHEGKRGYVL
jgi:phenylalanyl-tRNA synthetase alpha chain